MCENGVPRVYKPTNCPADGPVVHGGVALQIEPTSWWAQFEEMEWKLCLLQRISVL